jgi:hypothetical protein
MTSSISDNFPPGKTLETALRTALAQEEQLYRRLGGQKLARESQLRDARSSVHWLTSALDVTRVMLDSSAEVVSVLGSFANNLSSVMSMHGSNRVFGNLQQSLTSMDTARRSWVSVADIINNLLVQIEVLESATSSHIIFMDAELEAHKMIVQQSHMSLDTLKQSADKLSHSMSHKRCILYPIRRIPAEILEQIFELAALEERSVLRGRFVHAQPSHAFRNGPLCTVPRVPTILASTCRRWRAIALDMPRLWNFLCVPTVAKYKSSPYSTSTRSYVVGRSAFRLAVPRIGNSECEVVVGPTDDWGAVEVHLFSIPESQISIMNIIAPPDRMDFSHIPTARVFRIIRKDSLPPFILFQGQALSPRPYILPTFVLAGTTELECHNALPAVDKPIRSVTSFSLGLGSDNQFPDIGRVLVNFPNLTALTISITGCIDIQNQNTFVNCAHIRTLSVTDAFIQHLCTLLQWGRLSLPSLTHFILLNISPLHAAGNWSQLQSLFANVTRFEVRAATEWKPIRQLLEFMPLLQEFSLFDTAVNSGLSALRMAPLKRIDNLVILDSKTDGSMINSYYEALRLELANHANDNLGVSIQFVNCPNVLPHIWERPSS